jgi:hypothetical protein
LENLCKFGLFLVEGLRSEPKADRRAPAAAERRRRREKFGVLPARCRTDATDKIRLKSARRDKFLMKFGGIPPKLIKFISFLEKYVFFQKILCFLHFSVVKFEILTPNLKIYRKMYKFTIFPEKCKFHEFHEKRQWKKIFNWKFRNFQDINYSKLLKNLIFSKALCP